MLRRQIPEEKVMIRNRAWHEEHRIELHLSTRVEHIVPQERVVVADGQVVSVRRAARCYRRSPQPDRQAGLGWRREPLRLSVPRRYARDIRADEPAVPRSPSADRSSRTSSPRRSPSRGLETHWLMRGPRPLHRIIDDAAGELVHEAATGRRRAHALRRGSGRVRTLERRHHEGADDRRQRDRGAVLRVRLRPYDEHGALRRGRDRNQQERHPLRRSPRNER